MEQFELNLNECLIHPEIDIEAGLAISDRPILIFFITDTDYLYVYVPDNRYAEPIFIYCYKVHSSLWFFLLSVILTTTKNFEN